MQVEHRIFDAIYVRQRQMNAHLQKIPLRAGIRQ